MQAISCMKYLGKLEEWVEESQLQLQNRPYGPRELCSQETRA